MAIGGLLIRSWATILRGVQFAASAVGLGIFAYFLAVLSDHNKPIYDRYRAVTGITGASALYTLFGVLLTCILGGVTIFGFLAVLLDIAFIGAFIAVAWFTRHGAGSCSGRVDTPLGVGPSDRRAEGYGRDGFGFGSTENTTYFPDLGYACRLNRVVFALSIILIFLYVISAISQLVLMRRHKSDKKYGPSPTNNYTGGRGRFAFFKRNKQPVTTRDAEAATALPAHNTIRPSGETGTTVGNNAYGTEPKYGQPGYGQPGYGQATNY